MHLSLLNIIYIAHLLELILIAVHDSDSQNELLCVVIIENAVQVISKTFQKKTPKVSFGENPLCFRLKALNRFTWTQPTCVDLLCNLLHSQLTISHVLAVELDAQQPR